jgi:hypothetical protein
VADAKSFIYGASLTVSGRTSAPNRDHRVEVERASGQEPLLQHAITAISLAICLALLVGLLDVLPEKIDYFGRGLRRPLEKDFARLAHFKARLETHRLDRVG